MNHPQAHLGLRDIVQGIFEGTDRSLNVTLDDQVEFLERTFLDAVEEVVERDGATVREFLGPQTQAPLRRCLTRGPLVVDDSELLTRCRHAAQPKHLDWHRRAGGRERVTLEVEHGPHAAVGVADGDNVTDPECSSLHEERANGPATRVKTRFDDGTRRTRCWVCLWVDIDVCDEKDRLKELVKTRPLFGGNLDKLVAATPFPRDDLVVCEFLPDAIRVGVFAVDLVDGDDERNRRGLCVVDRFDRLRHHTVVGGDNDDGHVGDLRTAGTHGCEGLVARCVEEGQLAGRVVDLVGPDVLGNSARFTCGDLGDANRVKKGGLSVVDVPHHGDDRRPAHHVGRVVDDLRLQVDFLLRVDDSNLALKLLGDQLDRVV